MKIPDCFYVLTLVMMFPCCSNKKKVDPKLYSLSPYKFDYFVSDDYGKYHMGGQYFIITNAPKDTLILKHLIDSFNNHTLPRDISLFDRYQRIFYKESKHLNKSFIETEDDRIDNYGENIIAEMHWTEKGNIKDLRFYKNGVLLTNAEDVKLKTISNQ